MTVWISGLFKEIQNCNSLWYFGNDDATEEYEETKWKGEGKEGEGDRGRGGRKKWGWGRGKTLKDVKFHKCYFVEW